MSALKFQQNLRQNPLNDAAGRNGDDKVQIPGFAKIGRIQSAALNGVTVEV
jgi:hypothetical protein